MDHDSERREGALRELATTLEAAGANLTITAPGAEPIRIGRRPDAARVIFCTEAALAPIARRDHLALAEAYLNGEIDLAGDWLEILKVTEVIAPDPTWRERLGLLLRFAFTNRRRLNLESIAFHYERPPDFFLPWFERWRSYSHGFYATPDDTAEAAQARKLQYAVDALGLKPGSQVFDMGCGWGSFLEFAGRQGIRVHGITISQEQHRFVAELIREEQLPCTVELVDFLDYRPQRRFDGAVFMGTFEHFSDYRRALRFLAEHLEPEARFYADFCTTRGARQVGAFLAKYIWPGTATYVNVPKLLRELERAGFGAHALADDTLSYACTVRDWADALERVRADLAAVHGEESVRAFLLFLRASEYFFLRGKTQAYHLVAGREPASLARP
jgi:cyclopropane-fatty-acyl-phospholipid synthase